ncbi:MAG: 30S ribosomal protein S4 [Christensenellales bacterium]|jgi:ribosomal protein S4|nr:30S ribosomal protein S4 [Clostridiales bacterium]
MARYTDSVCRQCRREGAKLFLKGDRCFGAKCAIVKRPTPPGQHGVSRKKQSQYGIQLREKQKARRAYGVLEGQFRGYFQQASRMRGVTGENLLMLLERRLDNVVYRLGMGDSRAHARQLVTHGHIRVNGKKVNIPSFRVKLNDEITIRSGSQSMENLKQLREEGNRMVPKWLSLDHENLVGKVIAMPQRDDIDLTIEEHQIVELYSR